MDKKTQVLVQKALDKYKKDKSSSNRDELQKALTEFERENFIDDEIEPKALTFIMKVISHLPFSQRGSLTYYLDPTLSQSIDTSSLPKSIWDYIPKESISHVFKKPVEYELKPDNKGLNTIFKNIPAKDELRPILETIHFYENGVVATDAHTLLHLAGKTNFKGNYKPLNILKRDQKKDKNTPKTLEGRFPNFEAVVPSNKIVDAKDVSSVVVNISFLVSVIQTLNENTLLDRTTYGIKITYGNFSIGINALFLIKMGEKMMMLGHEDVKIFSHNPQKAILLTDPDVTWNSFDPIKDTYALLMPIMFVDDYRHERSYSNITIKDSETLDLEIFQSPKKELTSNEFYGRKDSEKVTGKKVPIEKPKEDKSDKDFLAEKIEAFNMMLEMEDNKEEKEFLKDKIEAFKMMLKESDIFNTGGEVQKIRYKDDAMNWWSSLSINEQENFRKGHPFFGKMSKDYFRTHKTSIHQLYKYYTNEVFNKGGDVSKTPAEKSEQIEGSDENPKGSAKSIESAKEIEFSEKVTESIKNKVDEHNKENPKKKVSMAFAKAVVRRGMGAYSQSHRPTISGGKENSRTAWGLARLDSALTKVKTGKSPSGKHVQDDDLIEELGYSVEKMKYGGEINDKRKELLDEWEELVNMTKSELESFLKTDEGKKAGMSKSEAKKEGIKSGQESAEWILKMKDTPVDKWTSKMWEWAQRQVNFIKRMSGVKGDLYGENKDKTRKHTSLLLWGHDPEKK